MERAPLPATQRPCPQSPPSLHSITLFPSYPPSPRAPPGPPEPPSMIHLLAALASATWRSAPPPRAQQPTMDVASAAAAAQVALCLPRAAGCLVPVAVVVQPLVEQLLATRLRSSSSKPTTSSTTSYQPSDASSPAPVTTPPFPTLTHPTLTISARAICRQRRALVRHPTFSSLGYAVAARLVVASIIRSPLQL